MASRVKAAFIKTKTITMDNSTVGLAHGALDEIKQAQSRKTKLNKSSKVLDAVLGQLTIAKSFLTLVADIKELETEAVRNGVKVIFSLVRDLNAAFGVLTKVTSNLQAHLNSDPCNSQLNELHNRLAKALQNAYLQVSEAPVGLSGNEQSGYRVSFNTLNDINEKVRKVLQRNLTLMDFLQEQQKIQDKTLDGDILLQPSDIKAFKESASQKPSTPTVVGVSNREVYENTAGDGLVVITGYTDVGSGYISSFSGTATVHHSKMGKDARIITGDVGGASALAMMNAMFAKVSIS